MPCTHMNFDASVAVARMEDSGRFVAEVRIKCRDCGQPFQFYGLPPGFNFDGPTVTLDGLEANLPICPKGSQPTPLQALQGYTVKETN